MSRLAATLAIVTIVVSPACAQSIVGESTYEDNFLHRPPPPEAMAPSGADATRKGQPEKPETAAGSVRSGQPR